MGGVFPYVRIQPETALLAVGLAALLGVLAALIPASRIWQINIVHAIRRVG
jgi:ABC-type antimicrobial peptide transport system permease subunit